MSAPSEEAATAPIPLIIRLLSGVAGLVVFLLGFVVSFGAIVAAPLGMWQVRRWAHRRSRQVTRIASLLGGVLASVVLAIALWSLLLTFIPRPTPRELQSAAAEAQNRQPVKLPDWYMRAFPQAAQFDSASRAMMQSPAFMRVAFVVSGVLLGVFFGIVGGAFGWCGATLLNLAWSGRR